MSNPRVAVFRPDDGRLRETVELLEDLGCDPLGEPLLKIEKTGDVPRSDADYVIFTSTTGVQYVADSSWHPGESTICAIGEKTANALQEAGYPQPIIPEEHSSEGLVSMLSGKIAGVRVEIARSSHGSDVLPSGLQRAGGYIHETILYRLTRPEGTGDAAESAAAGNLDGILFTSPLIIEHFLESAEEREVREEVLDELERMIVGCIGSPTRRRAEANDISVDVVPNNAGIENLANDVLKAIGK
ncbi:MAG: uroporphyrinogen-III synthase [Halobacteriaceae archaeon]